MKLCKVYTRNKSYDRHFNRYTLLYLPTRWSESSWVKVEARSSCFFNDSEIVPENDDHLYSSEVSKKEENYLTCQPIIISKIQKNEFRKLVKVDRNRPCKSTQPSSKIGQIICIFIVVACCSADLPTRSLLPKFKLVRPIKFCNFSGTVPENLNSKPVINWNL